MVNSQWSSFQRPQQSNEQLPPIDKSPQEMRGELKDDSLPQGRKPQWGDFLTPTTYQGEPNEEEEEGWLGYIARNTTANASRIGESAVGAYGELEKLGKTALTKFPALLGGLGYGLSELVGPEKWERAIKGPEGQQQMLPTTEDVRELTKKASKGYTEPRTPGERKVQELSSDIGSMLAPVTGRLPSFVNNLLIPAASNAVKQVVEGLGLGEDKAILAKLSTWLPLSLAANVNASRYASDLMNKGRNGIPESAKADIPRFTQRLEKVNAGLLNSDPRTALARQAINGLTNDIQAGQTSGKSLMTMYDAVNAAKRNRGMFELGKSDQVFAKKAIDKVRNAIRDEIMEVGKSNPKALQDWQNGVRAWAVIHRSNALTNWVDEQARGPYAKILTGPAAALFGISSYGATKVPQVSLTAAGAVPALYKGAQTLYRMYSNPQLYDYYWKAVSSAMAENAPAFIKNYQKLNKGLENEPKSYSGPRSPAK